MTERFSLFARHLLAPALILTAATAVSAQEIRVELEVTESVGAGLEEHFRTALERLEGVAVADPSELAHYAVTATILCVPDPGLCDSAESYGVSVVLSEPAGAEQLANGLSRTGETALEDWRPTPEARAFLQRYRRIHALWAASWDASSLASDVDRLVGGMDARCFQQRRVVEVRRLRLLQRGDTAAARNLPSDPDPSGRSLC